MLKAIFISLFFSLYLYASDITFKIESDFPSQTPWVKTLLTQSVKNLNKMFLNENVLLPKQILVTIKKNIKIKGISANARRKNNSINFQSNVWQKDKYRIWIMIHELVNLLNSYYGCNGYPSDWWANGRSPYPEYISVLIMQKLGYKQEALWRKNVHKDKNDHKFYWALDKQYGTVLFKKFFQLIKQYNIHLDKIGKPWPHPDKKRTLMTLSLLSIAANKNLANLATRYDIGKKPKDWEKRHPEIRFIPYSITKEEIEFQIKTLSK